MPRIYKPAGPQSNKAAAPISEVKTNRKPAKADESNKKDGDGK